MNESLVATARRAGSLIWPLVLAGCSSKPPEPRVPLTEPSRLCGGSLKNDCRDVGTIERFLAHPDLTLLDSQETHHGIQGARVVTLRIPADSSSVVFRAKWRPVSSTQPHTSPRRELAAYAVQKLFLRPDEYVVPPTGGRCFALDEYREVVDPEAAATFSNVPCVFGYLSYWLEDVLPPDSVPGDWYEPSQGPLDERLLRSSPSYRRSLARTNLLTYLIDHDDSHSKQFLVRAIRPEPIIYSVDNSMSFDAETNPKIEKEDDWSKIHVALPPELVDRLRAVDTNELHHLSVVEQYEVRGGRLVRTSIERELWQPSEAPVEWNRDALRVGLSGSEVEFLKTRVRALLSAFDSSGAH